MVEGGWGLAGPTSFCTRQAIGMETSEQEVAWLASLCPDQAVRALATMATLVTIHARDRYGGCSTNDRLVELPDFNERLHRLIGFIAHAARGDWTVSMAEGAVAQVAGLAGVWPPHSPVRRTLMQMVREDIEGQGS